MVAVALWAWVERADTTNAAAIARAKRKGASLLCFFIIFMVFTGISCLVSCPRLALVIFAILLLLLQFARHFSSPASVFARRRSSFGATVGSNFSSLFVCSRSRAPKADP